MPRELFGSALFAVDDADGCTADETGFPNRFDSLKSGSALCHYVLDQADQLPRFAYTFELVLRSIPLCLLAHNQKRQLGSKRGSGGKGNRTELRGGETNGARLVLGHCDSDSLAERSKQLGHGLEAVLVEVIARTPARAQNEIAL